MGENGKKQKEALITLKRSTGEEVKSRVFKRKLSNYCSIGIDARIGLGFDKNRSKHRCINKLIYAWEGIKKFLKPSVNVGSVIEKMETLVSYDKVEEVELKGFGPRANEIINRPESLMNNDSEVQVIMESSNVRLNGKNTKM